jgi:hypothetical protein
MTGPRSHSIALDVSRLYRLPVNRSPPPHRERRYTLYPWRLYRGINTCEHTYGERCVERRTVWLLQSPDFPRALKQAAIDPISQLAQTERKRCVDIGVAAKGNQLTAKLGLKITYAVLLARPPRHQNRILCSRFPRPTLEYATLATHQACTLRRRGQPHRTSHTSRLCEATPPLHRYECPPHRPAKT